jgi:uncharacterized DUF497 family protein
VASVECIWDIEDDPEGNVHHIAEHGVTVDEAEEVVRDCYPAVSESNHSGRPTVFGWTTSGKYLAVIFEVVDEAVRQVYVITAFEVPPPAARKRRRKKR